MKKILGFFFVVLISFLTINADLNTIKSFQIIHLNSVEYTKYAEIVKTKEIKIINYCNHLKIIDDLKIQPLDITYTSIDKKWLNRIINSKSVSNKKNNVLKRLSNFFFLFFEDRGLIVIDNYEAINKTKRFFGYYLSEFSDNIVITRDCNNRIWINIKQVATKQKSD